MTLYTISSLPLKAFRRVMEKRGYVFRCEGGITNIFRPNSTYHSPDLLAYPRTMFGFKCAYCGKYKKLFKIQYNGK